MTPYHRLRIGGSKDKKAPTVSTTSPKRKVPPSPCSTLPSPRLSGDYRVLQKTVRGHRDSVRSARSALASSLDRLGEHHVRQKEFDAAMDAFTEALHEKRSIYANSLASLKDSTTLSLEGSFFDAESDDSPVSHDLAVDEIIITLRNMGNVHSLRGEQDEAMRYYTEVTNLRATKTSSKLDAGDESSALFSALGVDEDNSALMSEINEDVKALDDMFRSISFRNNETGSMWTLSKHSQNSDPLSDSSQNASPSNKRRKAFKKDGSVASLVDTEPFRRSGSLNILVSGNEVTEALDAFKALLEKCDGPTYEALKETYNSFALRVELLSESGSRPSSPTGSSTGAANDLELAVEINQHTLEAQKCLLKDQEDEESINEFSTGIASTLIRTGGLYYKLGNRLEELRMYNEAKDIYCTAFGENHAFVAGARKNIGMVLAERGEYDEAMEEFNQAKKTYLAANRSCEQNRDVASAISCMGNVKSRVGELDEAVAFYTEALSIYKSILENAMGDEESEGKIRDVTATLKIIGMVHVKKGDLDKAMSFFTEAMSLLSSTTSVPGKEATASVLTRMASIHVKKGDLDKAMEHYRKAYELTVHAKGTTNHQDVAGILHYIGGILHKRSEFDEAMNCYQEAIRIYHATLGPGNPTVAGTLVMVGSIHYKRRNLDASMMFYREALRLNRDAYGLHHPDVAPTLKSIGTILTKKGEYHEAYDVFRDVLSIKCTIHGTGHPEVASAYKSLGNVHYKLGELADAERQYRHALSIFRRTRGNEHPDTIAARTTIEHIRYWMKERGQRKAEERNTRNTSRGSDEDERSC